MEGWTPSCEEGYWGEKISKLKGAEAWAVQGWPTSWAGRSTRTG